MAVPANICVAWPSTAASIPSGWTRETALDARYILGAAAGADTDLATDRGFTTHVHTSPAHTPTQNSHTHTVDSTSGADNTVLAGATPGTAADTAHQHPGGTSAAQTATNNSITITVNSTSNDLAFLEVIWIKSDGSPTTLPSGCIAFFASDSLPASWARVNGNAYLKGATAAGNGGGIGGANTHTHTSPAHTHTQNSHSHTATSAAADLAIGRGTGAQTISNNGHSHALTLDLATAVNQSVTTTLSTDSQEPPFYKVNAIQSSAATLPTSIIALWLSTNASIPADWSRITALDSKWAKGCNADGELATTGGALVHGHTASDCQPIQNAHTHSVVDPGGTGTTTSNPAGFNALTTLGHHHTWSAGNTTATNQAVAVTINNCTSGDALPKHRTVIYIQFIGSVPSGPSISGYTSYHYVTDGLFMRVPVSGQVGPDVGAAIARGDRRYMKQE